MKDSIFCILPRQLGVDTYRLDSGDVDLLQLWVLFQLGEVSGSYSLELHMLQDRCTYVFGLLFLLAGKLCRFVK